MQMTFESLRPLTTSLDLQATKLKTTHSIFSFAKPMTFEIQKPMTFIRHKFQENKVNIKQESRF